MALASYDEFLSVSKTINKSSPIFVDVDLGNEQRGEIVARQLFSEGFKFVHLATGYEKSEIDQSVFNSEIVGKSFPF